MRFCVAALAHGGNSMMRWEEYEVFGYFGDYLVRSVRQGATVQYCQLSSALEYWGRIRTSKGGCYHGPC